MLFGQYIPRDTDLRPGMNWIFCVVVELIQTINRGYHPSCGVHSLCALYFSREPSQRLYGLSHPNFSLLVQYNSPSTRTPTVSKYNWAKLMRIEDTKRI